MKYIWVTLLVVTLLNSTGNAARILGVFPYNGKSHFLMFEVLMKALSARGHEVEVVSHFPQKTPLANYTDISIEETLPPIMNNLPMDIVETFDSFSVVQFIVSENMKVCKKVIASPDIKKLLLNKHKYDLIVTETFGTDCLLGLIYKLQAPYISMISSVLQPWANDRVGNPDNPSYIPNYYLPYKASMNFFQRLKNAVFTIFINWYFYTYSVLPSDKLVQEHFGYDTPPIIKIANNVSLTLTNSHFSLNQARPMVPAVVEVGGIHLKVPGKLPKDIEKFIKESDDGVIYFSFGSMVQAETLPEDKLNSFLEVFEKLKQRVLWKCNPDKPARNIR
ncbi:hypothetical protein C0J52_17349 [Blattella germanica]|nr:hypothetical protein C0J52_17349 [Blattella germanica]